MTVLEGEQRGRSGPPGSPSGPGALALLLAYLLDGALEAGLLVLHPVHLSEGTSAQAGLARGPVDLLPVLVIHRLQFLGWQERGRSQWPGPQRDAESQRAGLCSGWSFQAAGLSPHATDSAKCVCGGEGGAGRAGPRRGWWEEGEGEGGTPVPPEAGWSL